MCVSEVTKRGTGCDMIGHIIPTRRVEEDYFDHIDFKCWCEFYLGNTQKVELVAITDLTLTIG